MKQSLLAVLLIFQCAVAAPADLTAANTEADRVHGNGKTALMTAAKSADRERVKALIQAGADVNRANHNGGTPIMYAALSGDLATVSLLLEHDADLNRPAKNGWTALMIASAKGYMDIAEALLQRGAEPDQPDVYAWTPLMRAVFEERPRIVRLLLDAESLWVNRRGENGITALHLAVIKNNPKIVRQLLEAGADPGIEDASGRTALDFARENKNMQLEELMKTGLTN